MKLLIHDLTGAEWEEAAARYRGWDVVGPDDQIRPCVGCFGCWTKDPGACVFHDGYETLGARIHAADEVVVLSRCTFGGFSSAVKNVFDRSIGWVLPFFELVEGEMHHCRRYPETKPLTVHFRGAALTQEEKALARRYVEAVCRNFRGRIREVTFSPCAAEPTAKTAEKQAAQGTILLNCSMRGKTSNSAALLDCLAKALGTGPERLDCTAFQNDPDALIARVRGAETIVFAMPLYVDGVPSHVLRLLEALARAPAGGGQRVYVVANNGLYESSQIQNLLGTMRLWSEKAGFIYGGGVAVGAGEMVAKMPGLICAERGPAKPAGQALRALAGAIRSGRTMPDRYADPKGVPRAVYLPVANATWIPKGRKNGFGIRDLCARR